MSSLNDIDLEINQKKIEFNLLEHKLANQKGELRSSYYKKRSLSDESWSFMLLIAASIGLCIVVISGFVISPDQSMKTVSNMRTPWWSSLIPHPAYNCRQYDRDFQNCVRVQRENGV